MSDPVLDFAATSLRDGSKSFHGAARLLPPGMREDAMLLYAWCRYCDDVIDGQRMGFPGEAPAEPIEARLAQLRQRTLEALEGRPEGLAFEALARVARRHSMSPQHPLDLIAGFEMDAVERRYETIEDTLDYCYHVAGVVGVMMAIIMGVRDAATLHRAADLGIAFQLTNICRDVRGDAAIGRVYLPADLLAKGEAEAVAALLALAEAYYESALIGLRRLPFKAAWGIAAARRIYREIARLVAARGYETRAIVSKPRKAASAVLALGDAAPALWGAGGAPARPRQGLWTKPDLEL